MSFMTIWQNLYQRKKSTEQIKTPISFKSLVDKKGIEMTNLKITVIKEPDTQMQMTVL